MENDYGVAIHDLVGREILDSRGNPTVEVDVILESGVMGRAMVPSGASTGTREALELRDKQPKRYGGKGVRKAVDNVNKLIAPALIGIEAINQVFIDNAMMEMDGTKQQVQAGRQRHAGRLHRRGPRRGGMARACRCTATSAACNTKDLPVPMMNVLNGGPHADNNVDVQEFMVVPVGAPTFAEALRCGAECYHALKAVLKKRGLSHGRGRRGRLRPEPAEQRGGAEVPGRGDQPRRATSRARTWCWPWTSPLRSSTRRASTTWPPRRSRSRPGTRWSRMYADWVKKYPIVSIEDGMAEGDWKGWKLLTDALGDKIQIVGDDVFVTNPEILARGIREGRRQQHPDQAEPDRHGDRDAGLHPDGAAGRLHLRRLPPLRGDGGHHDLRPGRGAEPGPDQDRGALPGRAQREVQPAPAHRGGVGRRMRLSGSWHVPEI